MDNCLLTRDIIFHIVRYTDEETLNNISEISKEEYLELYFEYVFSKIIKREE